MPRHMGSSNQISFDLDSLGFCLESNCSGTLSRMTWNIIRSRRAGDRSLLTHSDTSKSTTVLNHMTYFSQIISRPLLHSDHNRERGTMREMARENPNNIKKRPDNIILAKWCNTFLYYVQVKSARSTWNLFNFFTLRFMYQNKKNNSIYV